MACKKTKPKPRNGKKQLAKSWRDLEGPIRPRETGAGRPTLTTWRTPIQEYVFAANDIAEQAYHMPHDWVPGSDLYLHVHWSHTGTNISGQLVMNFAWTYAKGHQQSVFPAATTFVMTLSSTNITTYPQYQHNISEFQFSASSPTATQIDTDNLQVDGLIIGQFKPTTIPTVTGGSFFVHYIDIHYESTNDGTQLKSPPFDGRA